MQNRIIQKYVIKEIIPNYLIGVGFLSVIFVVITLFQLVQLVVEKNVPVDKVIKLLILYLPLIFQFTIPIAVIVGTLLAIGRLSDDTEIIAMRACGISLFKVFLPVIWFGIFVTLFTLFFYEIILPESAQQYAEAKIEIYQINPTSELSKSLSFKTIDGITISVDAVNSSTNELINVRINYLNENKLIFARRALLLSKDYEKNAFPLILFNSTIQPGNVKDPKSDKRFDEQFNIQQTIYIPDRPTDVLIPRGIQVWSLSEFYKNLEEREFQHSLQTIQNYNQLNKLRIDFLQKKNNYNQFINKNNIKNKIDVNSPKYKDLFLKYKIEYKKAELFFNRQRRIIDRRSSFEGRMGIMSDQYHFHRKLAFSFSALAFALLGAPLGIFSKRAGKSLGFGLSILIIIIFIGLVFLGNFLFQKKIMHPILASWYADGVLYIIGGFFIAYRLGGHENLRAFIKNLFWRKKVIS